MQPYRPTRIINAHTHFSEERIQSRLEECRTGGVVGHVMCGLSERNNQQILQARRQHGDVIIPFGYVDFRQPQPQQIDRLKEQGFVGLKFLDPPLPFSHGSYMSLYERAASLKMPALFHTGWCAGQGVLRSLNMMPSELEPICKQWPAWRIVAAHLGNAWAPDAIGMLEFHPSLHFDLSGGFIRTRAPSWLRGLFLRQAERNLRSLQEVVDYGLIGRLVFSTDNPPLSELLEFYMNLMAFLEVPLEVQEKVYYGNMAGMLGLT